MINTLHNTSTLNIPNISTLDVVNRNANNNRLSTSPISARRLSQTITDIVSGPNSTRTNNRSSSNLSSPNNLIEHQQASSKSSNITNKLTIEFDGGGQIIVRPNRVIKGVVRLKVVKPIQASQIQLRFRAEEVATVKVRECGLENKLERIDQVITTYFDVNTKVWGFEPRPYLLSSWEVIDIGEHEYPFALKFPNVNFPPSTDDPVGFSIHYIWSAHLDGPAYNPGLRSKEYVMPYRPIICAPPPSEWTIKQTVYQMSDKKSLIANAQAILPHHSFCPDEDIKFDLQVDSIPTDLIVSGVDVTLQKFCIGQLQLQHGLARKCKVKKITSQSISSVTGNAGSVKIPIQFHVPTRLVSPSFQSRHLSVFYSILVRVYFEKINSGLSSLKSVSHISSEEWSIPIGIANLPYNHLLRIPNLTSVESYAHSKASPVFFDFSLDEPPVNSIWNSSDTSSPSLNSPPPSYFSSVADASSSQFITKEREERTHFTSRLIKTGMVPELGEPVTIISPENKNYTWLV
ncbi:MAG: hypothetical protein EXX96DRAFT_623387 [Benjaminiella poitrasii]|nr:MAG: hypothetical protein EXX96DRAFT_623387 [Benjaminiella poitrasii]